MTEVAYAVEGWGDEPVAAKLIQLAGCIPRRVLTAGGKSRLDPKIPGYNRSGEHLCWLVLRDLDHDDDGTCVPDVLEVLLKGPPARKRSRSSFECHFNDSLTTRIPLTIRSARWWMPVVHRRPEP